MGKPQEQGTCPALRLGQRWDDLLMACCDLVIFVICTSIESYSYWIQNYETSIEFLIHIIFTLNSINLLTYETPLSNSRFPLGFVGSDPCAGSDSAQKTSLREVRNSAHGKLFLLDVLLNLLQSFALSLLLFFSLFTFTSTIYLLSTLHLDYYCPSSSISLHIGWMGWRCSKAAGSEAGLVRHQGDPYWRETEIKSLSVAMRRNSGHRLWMALVKDFRRNFIVSHSLSAAYLLWLLLLQITCW